MKGCPKIYFVVFLLMQTTGSPAADDIFQAVKMNSLAMVESILEKS